jgi:hypothetical protein
MSRRSWDKSVVFHDETREKDMVWEGGRLTGNGDERAGGELRFYKGHVLAESVENAPCLCGRKESSRSAAKRSVFRTVIQIYSLSDVSTYFMTVTRSL